MPVLKLIASWLEHGILATSDPAATDGVNGGGDNNEFTENSKKRLPEKGRRGKAGGGRGVAKPNAADNSSLHHTKLALLYIKWMLVCMYCGLSHSAQHLYHMSNSSVVLPPPLLSGAPSVSPGAGPGEAILGTKEHPPEGDGWGRAGPGALRGWITDEQGGVSGHAAAVLESGPSASDTGGVGQGVGFGMGWDEGWLIVDPIAGLQSVAQDEACYCEDIHSLVVWCEGVCGQAIRQASLLEGQEGMGRLRKRKMATTAPLSDLSECDQAALQVAQVRCSP